MITNLSIVDFFRDAPVLATVLTLAYTVIVGLFVYMLVRMYRK